VQYEKYAAARAKGQPSLVLRLVIKTMQAFLQQLKDDQKLLQTVVMMVAEQWAQCLSIWQAFR
jgi:hypothetical protein